MGLSSGQLRKSKTQNVTIHLVWYHNLLILNALSSLPPFFIILSFDVPFLFFTKSDNGSHFSYHHLDTTVNLSFEKIGNNLSPLIHETSLTISTSAKSDVKVNLVTFVRVLQWIVCMSFPSKREIGHLCCL